MLTKIANKKRTPPAPSSSSRFFANLTAALLLSASLLAGGTSVALADNPANLQLVWARTAGEQTSIYAEQSTASAIIVSFWEWEKNPRLQAKTSVGLRYYGILS